MIAASLVERQDVLRSSQFGRFIHDRCGLRCFKERPGDWKQLQTNDIRQWRPIVHYAVSTPPPPSMSPSHLFTLVLTLAVLQTHSVLQKMKTLNSWQYLREILTEFQNSFTGGLANKFSIKWSVEMPAHILPHYLVKCYWKCIVIKGSMYKVMKTFICRGCVIPVTSTGCTSVDIGVSADEADMG